jgi:TonB family protein
MKKAIILPPAILIFYGFKIFAQNEMADNPITIQNEKTEIKNEVFGLFNFTEKYEINTNLSKKAKILSETQLRTRPAASSEQIQLIVAGTIVETYKYFPKEAAWAIKYDENWGFVPATVIMPVQEKVVETNQTPYDEAPKMLSAIQISYPVEAKKADISGKVIVKALISKTGSVLETEMVKSIPGLDETATEAVKKVKFKPGKFEGKPVEVWIRIPINFEIGKF